MPFYSQLPPIISGFNAPTVKQKADNLRVRLADDCVTCGHQIFVGLFFDGTDNNMYRDKPKGAHTNVVRLFDAYPEDAYQDRYYKSYIPGVGTPFEEIGETVANSQGSPFGKMGAARIYWAILQLMNALHRGVFGAQSLFLSRDQAKQLVQDLLKNDSWEVFDRNEFGKDLLKLRDQMMALRKKLESVKTPKLLQVNLSVFGFSRGAAEARVFCNWLNQIMQLDLAPVGSTPPNAFAGVPISLDFLGIFDTVASVGIADMLNTGFSNMGGHLGWGQSQFLKIHPSIKKCVHLVAGHEVRASFPVDLAGYAGNCDEYVYPGAHSDVGGGYANGDIGVASNNYSRIPLQHMYYAAYQAGVPLLTANTKPQLPKAVSDDYFIEPKTAQDVNYYMPFVMDSGLQVSTAAQLCYVHWSLYLRARVAQNPSTVDVPNNNALYQYNQALINQVRSKLEETAKTSQWMPDPVNVTHAGRMAMNAAVPPLLNVLSGSVVAQWHTNEIEAMDTLSTVLSMDLPVFTSEATIQLAMAQNEAGPDDIVDQNAPLDDVLGTDEARLDAIFVYTKYTFGPVQTMVLQHIHDSSAGFITKMLDYVEHGEFSVNNIGLVRYRRIYSNSAEQSIHVRATPFKQTSYYKDLQEEAAREAAMELENVQPPVPVYQHGSPVPSSTTGRQRTSS